MCEIRGLLSHRRYAAGENVFREGDTCKQLMVFRSVQLKLTTMSLGGREQILGLLVAGQLVGFETSDAVYPYTATALTPVEVCCITHNEMQRVLEENPSVALNIIRRFCDELIRARIMIRNLGIKPAHARVASLILSLVPIGADYNDPFPLVFSRLEVAELLGLSEETVSRIFAEFRRNGLIDAHRGEVLLLDVGTVRKIAGVGAGPKSNSEGVKAATACMMG
ncbi:MAG: Crp/Fnr family transcriptional regulator [Ferrovum sp.]|nr:Crp/Fnr family transcriptional regulator [Ferrovum sp.]